MYDGVQTIFRTIGHYFFSLISIFLKQGRQSIKKKKKKLIAWGTGEYLLNLLTWKHFPYPNIHFVFYISLEK